MASFSNNPSDLILGFWMVCSLKVFNVWLHDQQTLCSLCFLFIHISLLRDGFVESPLKEGPIFFQPTPLGVVEDSWRQTNQDLKGIR